MQFATPPLTGKVLGLYVTKDAGALYRVVNPLRAVADATWAKIDEVTQAQLEHASTVVFYRLGGLVSDVQAVLRSLRQTWGVTRILLAYDDAFFAPIPVKQVRPTKAALAGVKAALASCDGVIVTNEDSAHHYRAYTDAPITHHPNLVWLADWQTPTPHADPPVVLIAGSPSHARDWDMVLPALYELRRQRPDIPLRVLGCPHPIIKELRTEGREWTHDYAEYLSLLQGASIALCPLADSEFNRCKAHSKAIEYSLASGAAVIGSPTQYGELLNGRGIVVADDDPWGWAAAIDTYLTDPKRRALDASRLYAHAQSYDARRWADTLTTLYTQETASWHYSKAPTASSKLALLPH